MATPYYSASSSGTRVPVVQGTFVSPTSAAGGSKHGSSKHHNNNNSTNSHANAEPLNVVDAGQRGTQQQSGGCKDWFWALLFYVHLGAIVAITIKFAPLMAQDVANQYVEGYNNNNNNNAADGGEQRRVLLQQAAVVWAPIRRFLEENADDADGANDNADNGGGGGEEEYELDLDMNAILVILALSGLAGFVIAALGLSIMITCAKPLIKVGLFFNLFMAGIFAVLALLSGALPLGIMACLGFLFTAYYTYVVWSRIPFAASNLVCAATAIRSNLGVTFFAFGNLILQLLWALWWSTAFVSTTYVMGNCQPDGTCESEVNGGIVFLFFVSFYWVAQVVSNVVHVTVAGTVGTWWFHPQEANGCCSQGVRSSYWRSITTSFGSICLGSLIVALIQATREMIRSMQNDGEGSMLLCLADCLLSCIESLAEYFNKWAYCYVGLYGYGFIEASINVLHLFQARGWSAIIADTLVDTVLFMLSICGGLVTGVIGILIATAMGQGTETLAGAFLVGMIIGIVLCSTLFGLVSSATNTIIVCFAEAPQEFQANHPVLSEQMLDAWRKVYPTEFSY